MKFPAEDKWFLALFVLFLVSSLSAVTYLTSDGIFDAKITYVNNVKAPYSVILEIENHVDDELDLEIEIVYEKENLIVGDDRIKCSRVCETKIELRRVFFDDYYVLIRTKHTGKYYEKRLNFNLEKPDSNFGVDIKPFYVLESNSSLFVSGKLTADPSMGSKYIFHILPKGNDEYREVFELSCQGGICDFNFELKSNIFLGDYVMQVYSSVDSFEKTFKVVSMNEEILDWNEVLDTSLKEQGVFVSDETGRKMKISTFPKEIVLGEAFEFEVEKNSFDENITILPMNLFNLGRNGISGNNNRVRQVISSKDELSEFYKHYNLNPEVYNVSFRKPQRLVDIEENLSVSVDKYVKKSNGREDVSLKKRYSNVEFENSNLNDVKKFDVMNSKDFKSANRNFGGDVKTEVVIVEASNFSNAVVYLKKDLPDDVEKILTCNNILNGKCLGSWTDAGVEFEQNGEFVWFNVTHFSAYAGVGAGYVFDVDLTNYSQQKIFQNNIGNVSVNVSCDNTGNCGNINVTVYYLVEGYSFFEGFEAGSLNTSFWNFISSNGFARQQFMTAGTCGMNPSSGTYFIGFDSNLNGNYETSVLKSVYDFRHFRLQGIDAMVSDTADESNQCGDHTGDTCNGEGTFFTCDGNQWYELDYYNPASLTDNTWYNRVVDITADPNFCSYLDDNFAIKFTQYDNYVCGTDGMYFDSINLTGDRGFQIDNVSSTPFWIVGSQMQQVNLNQNTNQIINFSLNATGNVGDKIKIYVQAQSASAAAVVSHSNDKIIFIVDGNPPSGSKIAPSSGSTLTYKNISFTANATDDYGVERATLYVWKDGSLVGTQTQYLGNSTFENIQINYTVPVAGLLEWNVLVRDVSENEAFLGANWTLNVSAPYVILDYVGDFADPFYIKQNNSRKLEVNVTCYEQNCGSINLTLFSKTGTMSSLVDFEDLESSFGDWSVDGGSCDWTRDQAGTPSGQTGPTVDHTLGTAAGWYAYVETSAGFCDGGDTTATLTGPTFSAGDAGGSMTFWYHMFGNAAGEMGDLFVDVYNGTDWNLGVWGVSGQQQANQGDAYLQGTVDLSSYSGTISTRFRYEYYAIGSYRGDVAIDDFNVSISNYVFEKMPIISSSPLWTNSSNPQTISLNNGQSQVVTFYINATGSVGSIYPVLVNGNILSEPDNGINATEFNVTILDRLAPNPELVGVNVSNVIRGGKVLAYSFWNYTDGLESAFISHKGNGSFVNYSASPVSFAWANYTLNTSDVAEFSTVGNILLKFYAEDIGIFGVTSTVSFNLYDYANLSSIVFSANPVNEDSLTTISCFVQNEALGIGADNVRVNFYDNVSGYLGYSRTNSTGYAFFNKTYANPGVYNVTCSVVDSIADFYYASFTDYNISADLVVLDNTAPSIVLISPANNSQDIDGNVDFVFDVVDSYSGVTNCSLYVNGVLNKTEVVISELGSNTINLLGMPFAVYNWSIGCYDDSVNNNFVMSENLSLNVAPDTDGPIINLISPPDDVEDPDGNVTFVFNATDELVGLSNCSLYIDGVLNQTNSSMIEGASTSFFVPGLLTGVSYFWNVSCWDNYSTPNIGWSVTRNVTIKIDTTPPAITLISPANNSLDTNGDVVFEYTADDYGYTVASCSLYLNGVLNQTNNSISEVSSNYFYLYGISQGNYDWNVECTDTAPFSNSGNSSIFNFTVNYDFIAPVVTLKTPLNNSYDVDGDVVFVYNVSDESSIDNCSLYLNGVLNETDSSVSKGVDQNFSLFSMPYNYYNWTVECVDGSDDHYVGDGGYFYLNVSPDTTPPSISLISPKNNSKDADGLIYFRYVPYDVISNIDYCSLYVGGVLQKSSSSVSNGLENVFNLTLGVGIYNWYILCVDDSIAGNSDTSETRTLEVEISFDTTTNVSANSSYVVGEDISFDGYVGDKFWSPLDGANQTYYVIENEGADNATLPWQLSGFGKRKEFDVFELTGIDQTDVIVNLTVDTATLIGAGDMQATCADMRFVDNDGVMYDYWIVSGCNTASTNIYIRLADLFADEERKFALYYGNSSVSAMSQQDKVLPIFDRFEQASLDTGLWTRTNNGCSGTAAQTIFLQSTYFYEGSQAVQIGDGPSSNCGNDDEAFLDASFTVNQSETLSFYWKVDSEAGWDYLVFCLDIAAASCSVYTDTGTDRISGNVDWQLKTYSLTPGAHTIRFMYAKDGGVSTGLDKGWIDWVSVPEQVNFSVSSTGSVSSQMSYITTSPVKITDFTGFTNWVWDSTSQNVGNYSVVVFENKSSYNSNYNYSFFKLIPDTFAPLVDFVLPTPANNSGTTNNWTMINVSVSEINLDSAVLEFDGVNQSMTCTGSKPDYYCYFNKTIVLEGIYTYKVYVNDTYGNVNVTETRTVVFDFLPPVVNFIPPTDGNNSYVDRHWTYINASVYDFSLDSAWLVWNGINESLGCSSIGLYNYSCSVNKSMLLNGAYTYKVCANDSINNVACSEQRIVNINKTLPVINITSPLGGTKFAYDDVIGLNATTDVAVDSAWYQIDLNGTNYMMSNNSVLNWSAVILNLSGGYHTLTVFGNDSVGNIANASVSIRILPDKSINVSKGIVSLGENSYKININVTNNGKWQDYILYDFAENNFVYYNFNTANNGSSVVSGPIYVGNLLTWNLSLNSSESIFISYNMNGSGNYNVLDLFTVGID